MSNPLQDRVSQHQLRQQLVAHALNVSCDRPVHDEDGDFLGHWQDECWIETLLKIARELAEVEKNAWRSFDV
jgi:hypothetical protein